MSFKPPAPQAIMIDGPAGPIEAVVEDPGLAAGAVAVVCHPHPLQGGAMNNKVVHTLARACNECGTPSVRFNYRGVGRSAGQYDEGMGETEDALAVIAWAQSHWPGASLWLAGFSFGGGVALRASVRVQTEKLITVAPAAARASVPPVLPLCPWLLIHGDADDVIEAPVMLRWVDSLSTRPQVRIMQGAGHFFHGRLLELREWVTHWLRAQ